jgi:FtsH-binding integral membrane protein
MNSQPPPAYNPNWQQGQQPPYPTGQPAAPYPPGFIPPGGPGYGPQPQGAPAPPMPAMYLPTGVAAAGGSYQEDVEDGSGPKDPYMSFSDKSIRAAFIRKVYGLLFVMLSVVVALTCVFVFVKEAKLFVRQHQWLYWISYATFMVTYLVLACCPTVRRKFPGNFICLAVLTVAIGYMTAMISSFYDTKIVFIGMGICAAVCLAISLFAINTKYDFTSWMGVMFVIVMVMFIFGIFAVIFRNEIMMAVYGGIMALVFMVYLAIDTQMLMGGKKHELDPEEYIFAATQLFLDIIYIFWMILQLLGVISRN